MPTETITANFTEAAHSREHLRTFHLTGHAPDGAIPERILRPTILEHFTALPDLETFYPMCVHPDGSARPLLEVVRELEHAKNITCAFRLAIASEPSIPLADAAKVAIESLKECSPAEISHLRRLLPQGAFLVAYHADALVLLHAAALTEARRAQRTRFWEDVRHTAERLREMLLVDRTHAPDAISPEAVKASLGSRMGAFFNSNVLAKALQRQANPLHCMDAERRSRCETTLAMLEEAAHEAANDPAFFLFHPGKACSDVIHFGGAVTCVADSFAAALELSGTRLDRLTHLLRAIRVARLELNSTFDPAIHEEMLARFDWQSAAAEELMAIPPIVVLETADRLAQASLTSFGKLLRSGRPVQILITRTGLDPQDLGGFSPDFGYLAIAHRESFVLQSSMAQPSHLLPGLAAMARTQRPAVAVISQPGEPEAWLAESLLVLSRTFPLYTYDPGAGSRWSERFHLLIPAATDLNAGHAASVAGSLRGQFHTIPASSWNNDQMELPEYLAAYQMKPPLAIPYIWVEGANHTQQRALLTRDLVNFCLDRRRAWDLFEELSGFGQPKVVPNDNARQEDVRQEDARQEGARQEGAREALQQVIAMLTSAE
jgi:hypothetical protein